MPSSLSTSVAVWALYGKHLVKRAQEGLFGATLLPMLGNQIPLPGHAGKTIFIPKDYPKNNIRALTEGTIISLCPTSGHYYSGTVAGYGDAIGYNDFLVSIHEIPTMVSNDINTMSRYLGYKYEDICQGVLSAAGTWVSPDGATAQGNIAATTPLLQRFLFDASTTLASTNAPMYSDGLYHGVFHPRQTHDLFVSTSGGSQLQNAAHSPNQGWLEGTEAGAAKLTRASIGILGRVRILETTQSAKALYTGASAEVASIGGMISSVSGYQALVMGPGAFAAVDLENQRPQVYVKGFGSAGTADPINQVSSAGIKGYFTAIAMDTTNRLVRTASGKTL